MSEPLVWLGCAAAGAWGALCGMRALLHLLQLESYQLPGYCRAVRRVGLRAWLPGLTAAAANLVLLGAAGLRLAGGRAWLLLPGVAALGVGAWVYRRQRAFPAKKPLVFTPRLKRLCWVAAGVNLAGALLVGLVHPLCALLWPALVPVWTGLAHGAALPMERAINASFFRDAQRRLDAQPGLIRIGITGSYGKTSTKFMLRTLLAERYNTFATPSSFNTPMGVTRAIREHLLPEHEVFIAEMGARHAGDIRELCRLVHPTIGLLTSVGPQHLETFGTVARVAATKYELIEALPTDGAAFFARDGGSCDALYARCTLAVKRRAGDSLRAEDIAVGPQGSSFTLVDAEGNRAACQTRLLGAHNIQNLLLCCEVALYLGLTLEQLAAGIAKLEPVEHRLQLIAGQGVTVIDDAFNSNPAGAHAALAVLRGFPGRHIVVTPGMVELGAEQDAHNEAFGREMAQSADVVMLIGRRQTQAIARGLLSAGFPPDNLHQLDSLDESTALLQRLSRPGDTVLYENDLPDNYAG